MSITSKQHRCSLAVRAALFSTAAFAGLHATHGTAQEQAVAQADNLMLEEVIVTARRRTESLQDVPLTINALSRETLNDAGINALAGVAAFTPGFDFSQSFGRQDFRPAIRGQSNILGGANAGLFIDGFYVGRGGPTLPLTAMERVEVVKGPQGALYGRSTLAGAINYILKQPTEEFEGEARLTAGEDGEVRGDVTVRGPIGDSFGYMVSLSHYEYDGQYDNGFQGNVLGAPARNDDIGGEETDSIAAVLTWTPNDTFDAAVNFMYEDSDDDPYAIGLLSSSENNCKFGPPPNPPAGTPTDGKVGSAYNNSGYYCGTIDGDDVLDQNRGKTNLETGFYPDMGTEFEATRLHLNLGWNFENMRLQSKTSYHDYDSEARQDQGFGGSDYFEVTVIPGPPFPIIAQRFGFLTENIEDEDEWSQELTLSSTDTSRLQWLVGAYYYEFSGDYKSRNSSQGAAATAAVAPSKDVFPLVNQADEEITNYAVYGQLLYDFTDRLNAGLELRYNYDEIEVDGGPDDLNLDDDFDEILPRVTVDYALNDNSMVYGVVSKGNKPGDFNADAGLLPQQRAVDEETAWNYEIGVKNTVMDGRGTFNVSVYYIDWDDQQLSTTTVTATGGTTSILDNIGETEIWGGEVEFNADPYDWWNVYLGYAYTDTEIKDYRISAAGSVSESGSVASAYEEAAQQGFPYAANGDVIISGTESPQTSKHQVTLSNTIHGDMTSNWSWFARADYIYNSERYAQVYNQADTGEMKILNLRVGIRSSMFDIEAWVRNATDEEVSPALIRYVETNDSGAPFTFGPDRAIGATLPQERAAGITLGMRF